MIQHQNVEIKALCRNLEEVRGILLALRAEFRGTDAQTDIYFKVPHGRLKLRRGNIENALIFYERPDVTEAKIARITLFQLANPDDLLPLLTSALDILVTVRKRREIYFLNNVKIHLDCIKDLGCFIEIEVIGEAAAEIQFQTCRRLMKKLKINQADLVTGSYSDMLLKKAPQ